LKADVDMTSSPAKPAAAPRARRKPAAAPALVVDAPAPVAEVVTPAKPDTPAPKAEKLAATGTLRLKDLVEQVVAATGGKKKGVKEIVEATLTQLGLALDKGHMLNLPAFGKARIVRQQQGATGGAMTLKLRRGTAGDAGEKPGKQALAAGNDQG